MIFLQTSVFTHLVIDFALMHRAFEYRKGKQWAG